MREGKRGDSGRRGRVPCHYSLQEAPTPLDDLFLSFGGQESLLSTDNIWNDVSVKLMLFVSN